MKLYTWLKYSLYFLLLLMGILFEQASPERLLGLVTVGVALFVVQMLRDMFWAAKKGVSYTYIIDLSLIYGLELFSKFTMNYFIQLFYLLLMIEVAWKIRPKEWLILCLSTLFVSGIKVSYLIQSKGALGSFIQLGFFLVVGIMLFFILQIFRQYRDEKDAKEILYKELFDTHKKLKDSTQRLQAFSVVKERQRIARELHDALGHDLTTLIYRLEVVERMSEHQQAEKEALISDIKEDSRRALRQVRQVVETLRDQSDSKEYDEIKVLVNRFTEQTQIPVNLGLDSALSTVDKEITAVIYRVVQEGLTNVMRHANAHRVTIELTYKDDAIQIFFADDGSGSNAFKPGFGLKGMEERIVELGGHLSFLVDQGFIIKATIPIGGQCD